MSSERYEAHNQPLEIIAAEQHILTLADGLVDWMMHEPITDAKEQSEYYEFFTAHGPAPNGLATDIKGQRRFILERMDVDTNRIFLELLRAAYQRRKWKQYYEYAYAPPR